MERFQRHKSRLTECVFSEELGAELNETWEQLSFFFRSSAKIGLNERVEQRHHDGSDPLARVTDQESVGWQTKKESMR